MKHSVLIAVCVGAMGCAAVAGQSNAAVKVEGTKAPAVAPKALAATLIANKNTYALDPAQRGAAFRDLLKNLRTTGKAAPAAPTVDFTLRITNHSGSAQTFPIGGDESQLDLKLEGTGAVTIDNLVAMTMEFRMGNPITLEPGKTYDIPVTRLAFGSRGIARMAYFTEAGDYTLAVTLVTIQNEKPVRLTSDTVAFTVQAADKK
jgi:hypothetical protein